MKNDERITSDVKQAKSIGYMILWYGIFIVLLYRWFILNQTLMETLDFFIVWFIASLSQFFTLAIKGIPMSYPVYMNKKEQLYFVFLAPLLIGTLSAILIILRVGIESKTILGGFLLSYFVTTFLFFLYRSILELWEKRNM